MASDAPEFVDFVRQLRKRRRRARGRKLAYPLYVVLLAGLVYGGPAIARAVNSLKATHQQDVTTLRIEAAAPWALVALALLVLVGLMRQALWRGPVVLSEADTAWVLPLPVSRRRLMLPQYAASVLLSLVVAVVLGLVAGVVLHAYGAGHIGVLAGAAVVYAVSLAMVGVGLGALTERAGTLARFAPRGMWAVIAGAGVLGVLAARAAAHGAASAPARLTSTFGPAEWIGCVAIGIPAAALRRRAAIGSSVSAAVYVVDLRRARLAMQSAASARRPGLRLPPPRRASWSVPWRDLSNVLVAPMTFGWAAIWVALGSAAFAVAARHGDTRQELFPVALSMVCGYVAALPYTEATRLDADDFRRVRWSPYPIRGLAARHAIAPIALAVAGQVVGALVAMLWLGGRDEVLAVVAAVATAPVLAVAAMISAFRGRVPLQWLLAMPDIGFGPIGPVMVVFWYLLGPVAGVVGGVLAALPVLHALHSGGAVGPAVAECLAIGCLASAALIGLARHRASRLYAA